jgi:hypothetical protein
MRVPVHAIRAKIIGPQPIAIAAPAANDLLSDFKLFAATYAAGFLLVSLFIA